MRVQSSESAEVADGSEVARPPVSGGAPVLAWQSAGASNLTCRGCGARSDMRLVLDTDHVVRSLGQVSFYRCAGCGSVNAVGDFTDFIAFDDATYVWDHYLHLGAGIDSMVRPLERTGLVDGGRLLDVGCGYGFVLDYWNLIANGSAVGLEPSEYGARGRRELGVRIIQGYLSEVDEVRGERFDRVFSSEVIEHVPDPLGFLRELRQRLTANGIVILTTPDADFVRPDAPLSTLLAVLSPGLHQILFSRAALENVLKSAGFSHCAVEVVGERLVAYAANAPFALRGAWRSSRHDYVRYLRLRCERTPADSALGLGIRYRLYKEMVNAGRIGEATPIGDAIVASIRAGYGFDPLSPDACRCALANVDTFHDYAGRVPYFLPCFLFYAGMAVRQGAPGPAAQDLFACAAELCGDAQRFAAQFFQEAASLYWVAVFEEGVSRLVVGDRAVALRLFARVVDGPEPEAPHLAFCSRPPDLVRRAAVQAAIAVLQGGEPEEAMRRLRAVLAEAEPGSRVAVDALGYWQVAKSQAEQAIPRAHLALRRSKVGLQAVKGWARRKRRQLLRW